MKRFKNILLIANQGTGDHQLANRTQAIHKKGIDELIGNYSLKNLNHRLHFLKGDAAALITDLAAEHAIDLIVMGTVCRTSGRGIR